jgi:hypothetical protein
LKLRVSEYTLHISTKFNQTLYFVLDSLMIFETAG